MSVPAEQAPDQPTFVEITFDKGCPVALDGRDMNPVELLETLNTMGGENGVGTIDIIENRLVGMKSRGVYETPGGTILFKAHQDLEKTGIGQRYDEFQEPGILKYAQLVYDGLWFTPLKDAPRRFCGFHTGRGHRRGKDETLQRQRFL